MGGMVGAVAGLVVVMVLWFNPHLLNGFVDSVSAPVKSWKKDGSVKLPGYVIDPGTIKKPGPQRGGRATATLTGPDAGNSASTRDAGNASAAANAGDRGGSRLDPGYQQTPQDPGEREKVVDTPFGQDENQQKAGSSRQDKSTSFGATVVGVQRAKNL